MTDSPATASHAVLIRGINVGGRSAVPMAKLREQLTLRGFEAVSTYIQSGNVVLAAGARSTAQVTAALEECLAQDFGVETVVVTVSAGALQAVVADAPSDFGAQPELFHYDVAFLREGLSSERALPAFSLREGVDSIWPGAGAVYFRRLSAERTKSKLSSVMSSPMYQDMTIRNWRTTTTLVEMLRGR